MIKQILYSDKAVVINSAKEDNLSLLSRKVCTDIEILQVFPSWYKIDDKYYYFKEMFDLEKVINELLGVHLAKYFGLKTAKYKLAIKQENEKYITGLISQSVFNEKNEYKNLYEIGEINQFNGFMANTSMYRVLELCTSNQERKKVLLEILKMSIMDFYSHQVDRVYPNINFQIKPNISLAPLYDYSETFDESGYGEERKYTLIQNSFWKQKNCYVYQNDLLKIKFPSAQMEHIFNDYPDIYQSFLKILDLDLEKYLSLIQKENDLKIPDSTIKHYMNYDEEQKNFVRKIK